MNAASQQGFRRQDDQQQPDHRRPDFIGPQRIRWQGEGQRRLLGCGVAGVPFDPERPPCVIVTDQDEKVWSGRASLFELEGTGLAVPVEGGRYGVVRR